MTTKNLSLNLIFFALVLFVACNNAPKPPKTDIAQNAEALKKKTPELIRSTLEFALANEGKIDDTVRLSYARLIQPLYEKNLYNSLWSYKERWRPLGDSLINFIKTARRYGLFPEDYHLLDLDSINQRFLLDTADTKDRKDAALWSRADLLMTDAFMRIVKDIKLGRLPQDSITLRSDSTVSDAKYLEMFDMAQRNNSISLAFNSLEPKHEGYQLLKEGLREFLDSATDDKAFTVVPLLSSTTPYSFRVALRARLLESGYLIEDSTETDSVKLSEAVKKFQKKQGLTADGKAGAGTLRMLNMSDHEKFIRVAISMDRYKLLPDTMPNRYVWVNLPAFYLKLKEGDSVKMYSKVICGKPATRTPLLTSAISELITYPQWSPPNSIIIKEILPGIKKNPGYLAKKGFSLLDSKGDEVDPYTVDWSKYSKGIPYRVVQGSGDANSLGILKFNFPNKYAVYLHDTNQRYLFGQAMRSMSHGCVRVQDWDKLAYNIIRYDNKEKYITRKSPAEDSMTTWLARKEKHSIYVRNRLPVYIRYFTCEGKDGKLVFYDDIYNEDKYLEEKYFAGK